MLPLLLLRHPQPGRDSIEVEKSQYLLYDDFATPLPAGRVSGTSPEPIGGTRAIVDTNSVISIINGKLNFATGGVGNDGIRWNLSQARVAGRILIGIIESTSNNTTFNFGWDSNLTTTMNDYIRFIGGTKVIAIQPADFSVVNVGIWDKTEYKIALVMRALGMSYFIKGGIYTNWTLLYTISSGANTYFPGLIVGNTTAILTLDNLRIPIAVFIHAPLVYDTYTRSNGILGNSETSGPDSQVTPTATWVSKIGTIAIVSNQASLTVLSVVGISTVTVTTPDVIIDAGVTRTAGNAGIVLRYVDTLNYIIAYHDGTNCVLDKVVGGITTNVISAAATYNAGANLRVIIEGQKVRLFYNNAAVGTEQVISDAVLQTSTLFGLYGTDLSALWDNFAIWSRGTGGEYSILDNY